MTDLATKIPLKAWLDGHGRRGWRALADSVRQPRSFSFLEWQREKQAARDKDDADLLAGTVTRAELQRRNSMFGAFDLRHATVRLPHRG